MKVRKKFTMSSFAGYLGLGVLLVSIFLNATVCSARTFEEILQEGVISIGCKDSFRPFGFIDANGKWVGFDIDIAQKLSQNLLREHGLKTRWVKINKSSDRTEFLQNGTVDIVIASFSITPEREKIISYSIPYFLNEGLVILTHKNREDIKSIQDLSGKKVAVTGRSTGEKYLLEQVKGVNIIPVANDDFAHAMLVSGKCDAYFQDKSVCDYHVNHNLDLKLVGPPVTLDNTKDYYGIGLAKEAVQLKKYCDDFVTALKESGKYDEYIRFWFSHEGVKLEKLDKVLSFLSAVAYKLAMPEEGEDANLAAEILRNFILSLKRKKYEDLVKDAETTRKTVYLNNGVQVRGAILLKMGDKYIELFDENKEYFMIPHTSILYIK